MPRLFDPFFSTKASGRGLGLSVCHSIMARHGGRIGAVAKAGPGATFVLHFPAADPAALAPQAPRPAPTPGIGRVLVMDDDLRVARVLARMLARLGYQAETVADGKAAIEAYRRARSDGMPYAAAIVDLTVPGGMGGLDAMRGLRALDPQAKVVVTSGYSDDPVLSDCAAHGFCGALHKPFRMEDVAEAVSRALG